MYFRTFINNSLTIQRSRVIGKELWIGEEKALILGLQTFVDDSISDDDASDENVSNEPLEVLDYNDYHLLMEIDGEIKDYTYLNSGLDVEDSEKITYYGQIDIYE